MQNEKLKLLGFDESIRGVRYMDAALQMLETEKVIRMGDLCAKLASKFGTNPVNVSSGIRYAIKKWWIIAPLKVKSKHFQMNCITGKPPANKTFLTYVLNENVNAFKEGVSHVLQ